MKEITCIVIGGGYAGINAVKALQQAFANKANGKSLRLILINKEPHHFRKVLLFKPPAGEADSALPLTSLFPEGVQLLQGTVTANEGKVRSLIYMDTSGNQLTLSYDVLVVAAGSIIRQAAPEQGGIALNSLEVAASIRESMVK
ncbi:FAD-dependent oxidoreductase [Paenibacillus sp. OSY-SE]|uniref:FAD-dependent oxidoreductase n=1 Tax=Paenibacillus sp. OSY-SE TaxID=1196323 RepID=UPI000318B526|nr:FAD-dependent oxidoreductase [Paenibacillus sp. OSY-SE]